MKAISLWEPWASAMAFDLKRNETRSWSTSYRGELAICSAKRKMQPGEFLEVVRVIAAGLNQPRFYPIYGSVLCVVRIFDCVPTEEMVNSDEMAGLRPLVMTNRENLLGNYTAGRFAWLTHSVQRLRSPVAVKGQQGLFKLPPEVLAAVRKQLP